MLKGFRAIQQARSQGDPTPPEKLVEAGYDGDEMLNSETAVLEVELVSFQKKSSWFVFEVEIDGQTPMSKVAAAADNQSISPNVYTPPC